MSQIEELQGRIAGALDRIAQGLDRRAEADATAAGADAGGGSGPEADTAVDGGEDTAALRQALEDERLAVAQWQERNKRLKAQRDSFKAELEAAQGAVAERMTELDARLQALREANEQLRENNARLREANAAGLTDAALVDAGLRAELEALRAARAADRAETELVMTELSAAVADVTAADQQEDA